MPLPTIQFEKFELEIQKQNTPLQEKAIAILNQAKAVAVVDNTSLKTANDIKKEINAQVSTVKEVRLEFTRPLDEFKKTILDAEKSILVNLDEMKRKRLYPVRYWIMKRSWKPSDRLRKSGYRDSVKTSILT